MDDPGPSSNYYRQFASAADGPLRPPSPPRSPILGVSLPHHEVDTDYYALLNLPKEATEGEIRERYRSLATTFHPDRQRSDRARQAAHSQFTEIQRAYEILIDPTKRSIYDMFGEEGLKTSWEVGPRVKTPEEMRKWFMGQAYEKRSMEAEALVRPKSEMEVVLDARAVFLPAKVFKEPEKFRKNILSRVFRIRPGRTVMKHSFEMPYSSNVQFVVEGQALSSNGRGGANLLGTIKYQYSQRLWIEAGTTLMHPRIVRTKGTYTIDEDQYITTNLVQARLFSPPQLGFTYGRRLYAYTTGFISYEPGSFSIGPWGANLSESQRTPSSLSVGLTNSQRSGVGWTVQTTAGQATSQFTADYAMPIPGGLKMKVGVEASLTQSVAGFVAIEGRMTTNVKAGVILQAEFGGGIILKFKFNRLGQKISVPILLSERIDPMILFGTTLLPAVTYAGVYKYYLVPRKKNRVKERMKELREENQEFIKQKREDAKGAVEIMERSVEAKIIQERQHNGLIIVSAYYGLASSFTPHGITGSNLSEENEEVIDVTVPVQALVQDSRLYIPGGKGKHNILGFYDPCIGEHKQLRVRYLFRGKLHEVTVEDVAALRAPIRTHAFED
ncbi:uncharacterized protein L203_105408 [Cryptococcus depauperatus CBS 7841]|uniref:Uncharacterized protein n=1 Tax=Cryptococcus depauperatus CBS 7841 TaxID=1295531 RepID=A0A1E3ICP3_9TREE|nr:hypothetical protein L203_04084 [Cryptococcus depauperatus CBS 7841]